MVLNTQTAPDVDIGKYLDEGTLDLFAQQLVDSLDSTVSVAVCNSDGRLAWHGPGNAANPWAAVPLVDGNPGQGNPCIDLGNGLWAHAFSLGDGADDSFEGYLLIAIGRPEPLPSADVRRNVTPILNFINKQLDIGLGLSAARRQTARERANMSLLYDLAKMQNEPPSAEILAGALRAAGEHFASDLIVMWLPDLGINLAYRGPDVVSARQCNALAPVFERLVLAAQRRRKLLVAEAPAALRKFAGSEGSTSSILSVPLLNNHDEVAGVLAVVRASTFARDEMRLVRVVSAKLSAIAVRGETAGKPAPDRHTLLKHVDRELSADPGRSCALLLVDIDKLHVINEMHGHFGGDAAIASVMQALQSVGSTQDVVCQLSGGAMALYLSTADETAATKAADDVRKRIADTSTVYEGRPVETTVSIGIALMPSVVNDAASALNTAEVAVRSAKGRGGDTHIVFNDLDASVMRRREDLDQVGQLQAALLENRFQLYAQRIVSLQEMENRPRYEILLRMLDEDGTVLAPDRFLSAAERYQMMSSIDRWVVRRAMDMLSTSDNLLEINLASFSINLSVQSINDKEFPAFVEQCVHDSGISPDTFCFEITESAVMRNLDKAQDILHRFASLGCRLALDDFGTGQCSFAYLRDLPVQYVKIDGSFVRDILENPLSEAIVESVARISRVIHARTVAEYVENDTIMSRLRELGIDFAQGYRIGKPKPLDDVLAEFGAVLVDPSELLNIPA